jgi:thiosulfate dehydrogenase (quinone) large subunit
VNRESPNQLTNLQQTALIVLRTLIGWHFLYEGYYKLTLPGWSSAGVPLQPWSSAGYLKAASGPLAGIFQWMIDKGWIGWMDTGVKLGLLLVGLSLTVGLFTRAGCWGALFFLGLFYLLAVPLSGSPQPGNEGTYLIVNKTLIEGLAVFALLAFRTGTIAGLDLLLANRKALRITTSDEKLADEKLPDELGLPVKAASETAHQPARVGETRNE